MNLAVCALAGSCCIVAAGAVDAALLIRCSSPEGPSLGFGHLEDIQGNVIQQPKDGFVEDRDGFRGVYPTFMIFDEDPKILWSIWGSTVPEGLTKEEVEAISPTELKKSVLIHHSETYIASVSVYPGSVYLDSFFPKLGIAYFSRHKVMEFWSRGTVANGYVLASECTFD